MVKVDLQTNSVVDVIIFNDEVVSSKSYLNDVRINIETNFAYISESELGAIIVVHLFGQPADMDPTLFESGTWM